ncbi:MAG: hypothetical protein ACREPU_08905 [Rhodanobacteraceae bacterium]
METPVASLNMLLQNQRAAWRARVSDYAQRRDGFACLRAAVKAQLWDSRRAGFLSF